MSEEPVLRPEEVQGVLSGGEPLPELPRVQPYSLREPMAIPPAAVAAAREKMESIVEALGEAFAGAGGIELTLDDLQQQTAAAALAALPPPPWIAALTRGATGGLALALHPQVGLAVVDLAMGGPGTPADETRAPTPLESRVLQRLLASGGESVGAVLGETLAPASGPTGELPPAVATPGETLAVGLLRFKIGEGHHTSLLLVTASMLVPDTQGADAKAADGQPGPLARLLERVTVEFRPVLPAGTVSFHDMMAAQAGSVLRLDAAEDAPFELHAEGHAIARGRIVKNEDGSTFGVSRTTGHPSPEKRSGDDE